MGAWGGVFLSPFLPRSLAIYNGFDKGGATTPPHYYSAITTSHHYQFSVMHFIGSNLKKCLESEWWVVIVLLLSHSRN